MFMATPPKPESTEHDHSLIPANSTSPTPPNTNTTPALSSYMTFLTSRTQRLIQTLPVKRTVTEIDSPATKDIVVAKPTMASTTQLPRDDPSSPLHYPASQTALVLMDFQNFIVSHCGSPGAAAVSQAKVMRDWALDNGIMVVHSIIDLTGPPAPPTRKGQNRFKALFDSVKDDANAVAEHEDIAFEQRAREYLVLKRLGVASALKTGGAMELLAEHGIKSLILCGLSTSGCVLRTAVPAVDDGFVVSVIEDACAEPAEGLHDVLMQQCLAKWTWVVKAEEFVQDWDSASKRS
ncbi:hypothetical protein LTR86_005852 [Recurvomyces mirabilis]|nr:hypothetical protein LTR86_005852 [Recurvomyces mirabilis]